MESKEESQVACDSIVCKEAGKNLEELEVEVSCLDEEGET
jgi:hypothetical protein